ncbi:type 11 methyltransferase [Actinoplanes sp. SE50]|uniref:class I SAM-dependent methyltransferase n=1 Tax=unclassified Actinoplanes TaxID=2626549 RepID=UPI00023EBEFB|nr:MULTISPECIES: class I SAM-dependent methyltransferase [unclassified Actinoplanes]AEV84030.1 methyltransferase type 11 [Actinoplanes sp. SE50/110]ATO82423.1 type 11 methyltransferase [Actinoplanes sp. SE50]SLL99830.1 type 11 methyltransferase [Actinoplanes sp. SE50/110]
MTETTRPYIPAMGRHGMLFLYDPFTRVAGLRRVHAELLDRAGARPGQRVLEIGCGPGDLLLALARRTPQSDLTGIDPDPAALRKARRKAARRGVEVRFEQAYADCLPLPDASVDRVLSCYMLHHLEPEAQSAAFREVRRVLRPGGELHLVDADGAAHGLSLRLAGQTPERIVDLMRSAGLTDPAHTGRGAGRVIGRYAFYRANA